MFGGSWGCGGKRGGSRGRVSPTNFGLGKSGITNGPPLGASIGKCGGGGGGGSLGGTRRVSVTFVRFLRGRHEDDDDGPS